MLGTGKKQVRNKRLAPKAAERRPRADSSKDKFRTLADNAPDIIARFDRKLRHLYVNRATERTTGLTAAQMIGRTNAELGMPAELVEFWRRRMEEVFRTARPAQFEFDFAAPDGPRRYESRVAPETAPDGRVQSILVVSRDISEQKRADEALREREQRYRGLFEHMSEGFFLAEVICDDDGTPMDYRYLDANAKFEELTGVKREDLIGRTVREALPGVEDEWVRAYGGVALTGQPAEIEGFASALGRHYDTVAYSPRPGQFACLFQDVTERKSAKNAILQSSRRLAETLASIQDGFFTLDREWRFTYINDRAAGNLGFKPENLLGRNLWETFPGILGTAHEENYRGVMEGRSVRKFEMHGALTDRWYSISAYPSEEGISVFWQDISEHKHDREERQRVEDAMRTANERLRDADRRKDEFLATLSHELRGPLAPIRSGVHILRQTTPGGEQARRALDIIDNQSGHLTRLVDDLLDLNRISRGQIKLKRRRCDLVDLARRAVEDHGQEFDRKGIALQIEEPRAPLRIDADPTRIAQVIGNLLGNACKFTPSGGRVRADLAAEDNQAVLRIRDTGAGIEAGLLETIFDPLTQAKQSLARSKGGLGLGLSLVKKLVEMHGGTVQAASEGPGRGSEFTVQLPLLAGAASEESPETDARPPRRLRILVIEDYGDAAESLRTVLELLGHDARVAIDGAAGLAEARTMEPDLVLCDIGLPDMDGYAVARQLRKAAGFPAVLLVALTGYALPEDAAKARDAGFDLHVAKPLSMEDLHRLLAVVSSRTEERPPTES